MRIRTQLLLMNLLSLAILVASLLIIYQRMLVSLKTTALLTSITLAAGVLSAIAYWWMTSPLIRTLNEFIRRAKRVAQKDFNELAPPLQGPQEIRQLSIAFHEMEQRLQESFAALEDGEQIRRDLVANISHDLRTPITCIVSFIEAIQDGTVQDEATRQRYLSTIQKEAKHLDNLIRDLFELATLDAGRQAFHPQPEHVEQILVDVLAGHQVQLQNKRLQVDVDIPDTLPKVPMESDKIARILGNLLQNAIRYTPHDGHIRITVREVNNAVEIVVCDSGIGIDAADESRLFERFYRSDSSRNQASGGAGLGLAIAKSLVELHGGEIGVKSRSDAQPGEEFWFRLPADETAKHPTSM